LVQAFGLNRCSAAKYVDGVALGGEHRFAPEAGPSPDATQAAERADLRKLSLEKIRRDEKS
jgi:hypothetical protein